MWSLEIWAFLRGVPQSYLVADNYAGPGAASEAAEAIYLELKTEGFFSAIARNGDIFFVQVFDHLRAFPTA